MKRKVWLLVFLAIIICPLVSGCFGKKEEPQPEVVEIYFYDYSYDVELNSTYQLEVKFRNNDVKNRAITWSSSDESVVSVDTNGLVTAHALGGVQITATSSSGHTAYCYIDVVIMPTSISLGVESVQLFTSRSCEIDIILEPFNCTETFIQWTSSDPRVASASGTTIYAGFDSTGTATLTATTVNGLTASVEVKVDEYVFVQSINILVDGVQTSSKNVVIPYGESSTVLQLEEYIYPVNASIKDVTWSSSNTSVAVVDENGLVEILAAGNATIYVYGSEHKTASLTITAVREVLANSISLNKTQLTLIKGYDSEKLSVSWHPSNVTYKEVTWRSSNSSVATVDENGNVTPVGVGNATITATTKNGISARCSVRVDPVIEPTSITLNENSISIQETKTFNLVPTILPTNATNKTVEWASLDESIATVENGVVKGVSIGKTKITATTSNGLTAEVNVEVTELMINVQVYVDGDLTETLQTCKSQDYLIELPEKTEDITTNSSLTNYFYGWFGDEDYSVYLNGNEKFESDSAIYAKNVEVLSEENADILYSSYVYNLKGISDSYDNDVLVIPQKIGGKSITALKANCISASNIKALVLLGFFSYENASISNCENLERILIYNYANESISNRDTFTKSTISNCSKLQYNEFSGIKYLGTLDEPYMVAIEETSTSLTQVVIPDECFSLGSVLNKLSSLRHIDVESGNNYYSSQSGILYNRAQNQFLHIPNKLAGDIVIPNSITSIESDAFYGKSLITSLNIGSGVKVIGADAFNGCSGITQITGGNSSLEIGNYAFSGCSKLVSCQFSCVKQIGNYAFSGCTKLETFSFNGAEKINSNAFYNCGLTQINIPNSVTYIGSSAFARCGKLTSVVLPFVGTSASESSTKYPFGEIFGETSYTNSIKTTQYYIPNGQSYSSSRTYYIPAGLKQITINGGNVNYGGLCNLVDVEVTLNNVDSIEKNAFLKSSITKLTLPNTLRHINGDDIATAFQNASINDVYFNGTINDWLSISMARMGCNPTHIANNLYINNISVKEIKSIDIENLTAINSYSLYNFTGLEEVSIPATIESIGEGAFYNCLSLKAVNIPSSVKTVAKSAFMNCEALVDVNIASGVESLENFAFMGASALKNVELPETISTIGNRVFSGCESLENITLPTGLTTIPEYAFENCYALKNINIHENISSIKAYAFKNCTSITEFEFKSTMQIIGKGVLYGCTNLSSLTFDQLGSNDSSNEEKLLNYYFSGASNLKSLTIKKGTLYDDALSGWSCLTHIVLENVTELGDGAFNGCSNLESLIINSDVNDLTNYTYLFNNAGVDSSGIVITFGKNVTKVPVNFLNHGGESYNSRRGKFDRIVFEEGSVCASIGENAFANSMLGSIALPAGVTTIGENAFYNCTNLQSISVDELNETFASVNGSLFNKDKTQLIQYACGSSNEVYEVTSNISVINAYAFYGTSNLKKLILNSNLIANQNSDNHIFDGMEAFEVVIGVNVERVPDYLFNPSSSGANISAISFADNAKCEAIGKYAFANASNIETIDLSTCVKSIENSAFMNSNISEFNYLGSLDEYFGVEYKSLYACPMSVGATLTINGESLSQLVVPESVTAINAFLFYNLPNLQTVTLHDGVTSVGSRAFAKCSSLKELHIPSGANALSTGSLAGLSALEELTLASLGSTGESALFGALFGSSAYDNSISLSQKTSYPSGISITYYIPKNLTKVTILGGSIGCGAFANISTINSIVIDNNVKSFDSYAFYNCSSLSEINIPDMSAIYERTFSGCSNLQNVVIPNSVESIGANAFRDCTKLVSVCIGDENGLTKTIGDYAFAGCSNLKTVSMFNLTEIASYAFSNCFRLRIFDLPASLETLGDYAFAGCLSIYSIKLHNNILNAGQRVFDNCSKLIEVYNSTNTFKIDIDSVLGNANPKVIHSSSSEASIIDSSNKDFLFVTLNEKKYLLAYEGTDANPILPTDIGNYAIRKYAFAYNNTLTHLTLPECVVKVEANAIYLCSKLEYLSATNAITFEANFANHSNVDVFNFVGSLEDWLSYNFSDVDCNPMHCADEFWLNGDKLTSLVVPDSVTQIGVNAFYNFKNLQTVTMGKNVVSIQNGAFQNCSSLTDVSFESSKVKTVGESVFENCVALTKFTMPSTLKNIGSRMFAGCSSLSNIEFNSVVETIGASAFEKCISIKSMAIPSTVKTIGSDALGGCTKLETLSISSLSLEAVNPAGVFGEVFGNTYYAGFNAITQNISEGQSRVYYIPSSLKNIHVESGAIVYGAFQGCDWFEGITLGSGVTYVNSNAFNLTAPCVTIENGVYYAGNWAIGAVEETTEVNLKAGTLGVASSAFAGITTITSFNASDSLKYINSNAFENCYGLNRVTLNDGLLSIGDSAFKYINITEITLPKSLVEFGQVVFEDCKKLNSIVVAEGNTKYASVDGNLYSADLTELIQYACGKEAEMFVLLEEVQTISDYAFKGAKITDLIFNKSLTNIGEGAFYECYGLTDISLPSNLLNIGEKAFYNCRNLANVSIKLSVEFIGAYAFALCEDLKTVSVSNKNWKLVNSSGEAYFDEGDLNNSSTVAIYFRSTYTSYQWTKNV